MIEPSLSFELVTIFPEFFDSFLKASLFGKAIDRGILAVNRTNPRDFARGRHQNVDDTPYGGGPGMVFKPEPIALAVDAAVAARGPAWRVVLSPQGRLFDQAKAARLAEKNRLLFVCGRYEGIDDRVAETHADEVLSIGDYVLAGGEVAAAVVMEAVARLVPGVLGRESSTHDESHQAGRLEYPQFTRPTSFGGREVPPVLRSGDHAAIDRWRKQESVVRTLQRRADLLERFPPNDEERRLLAERGFEWPPKAGA